MPKDFKEPEFKLSDVLLANRELYSMVGKFGSEGNLSATTNKTYIERKYMQLLNSDLFVKKCLLPLHSVSQEQVAEKLRDEHKTIFSSNMASKLESLHTILLKNCMLSEYFYFVPESLNQNWGGSVLSTQKHEDPHSRVFFIEVKTLNLSAIKRQLLLI